MSDFKPKFQTLVEIFNHSTEKYASQPLFGTKTAGQWNWMTYRDFRVAVDELRGGLASIGVTEGDRVGVVANNRSEWAVGEYAVFGLGASYVPMYESQKADELVYILKDCGASFVFAANSKIANALKERKADMPDMRHIVTIEGSGEDTFEWLRSKGRVKPVAAINPKKESIACYIYTSGTTGNPKGVKLSHLNIAANVSASILEAFPISPQDRSLSFLPWAHSFGQTGELHALFAVGASMAIAESVDKIIDNLGEVRPTVLLAVPRIFNRIYDRMNKQVSEGGALKRAIFKNAVENSAKRKRLASAHQRSGLAEFLHNNVYDKLVFQKVRDRFGGRLKFAISGGAALSKEVAEFIDNIGILIFEGYGLSETSPVATVNTPAARKIGSVGKAIPGVTIQIDFQASNDPQYGEIVIHGHNVMQGYHNLPKENEAVFTPDGGFRTGDLGYVDDDGFLYITGRIKEQYKLENGKYVAPAPLEELLKLSPFIASAFVFGDNKPYNVALIVPEMTELKSWAKTHGINQEGAALLENAEVKKMMDDEVASVSKDFKQFEKLKKIKLIAEDFTQDNGMLTPKLSLKRRAVMQKWGDALKSLYN